MSGGWVADRGIPVEVIVVGGLLSSAALMLVAPLVPLPDVLLIACIAGAGFLFGLTTPSRDLIVRGSTPKGASGRVFGFVYSGLDAGSALVALIMGRLRDHGDRKSGG